MSVETGVRLEVTVENHLPWVCTCQSARVRALADASFTLIVAGEVCWWCGRDWAQVNREAKEKTA